MRGFGRNLTKCLAMSAIAVVAVGCSSKEEAMVTVKYTLNPSRGLPAGLTQVAILPAELGPATDAKWSDMTSDMLASLIEKSRESYGVPLRVADRVETKKVFQESDLDAAGLTQGGASQPAQLLSAQAFIVSKVNVKSQQVKSKKTTISGIGAFGSHWGGGGSADTRESEKINQTITAQAKFQLVDAKTGETWTLHEDNVQSNEETDPGAFMGIGGSSDLSTEDEIAGVLIERVAREFISKLVPCTVTHEIMLESSGNENCAKGVALMRADMYQDALDKLKMAIAEEPDDHRAKFAAGVACEALGQFEQALKYYKLACVDEGEEAYLKAKKRLEADIEHIRRDDSAM